MYRIKRRGPKIEPCGMPEETILGAEEMPFRTTDCMRTVKDIGMEPVEKDRGSLGNREGQGEGSEGQS